MSLLKGSLLRLLHTWAQRRKRDYYLNMEHMRAFTDETLAIANAWLDPEVDNDTHTRARAHTHTHSI